MVECKFCENNFSSKSSLNTHQKSAKYCLKLQNAKIDAQYQCEGCKTPFARKHHLDYHRKTCKTISAFYDSQRELEEKDKTINDLKEYKSKYLTLLEEYNDLKCEHKRDIQVLQDKLENVAIQAARKPTHTNTTYNNRNQINTVIQNLSPVTDNSFNDNTQHLTIEHLKRGVKGYVEYALDYPLKNKVLCVDYSRRKIKYKDSDGNVQTDPEMNKLSKKIFESIEDKNKELAMQYVNKLSDDMDLHEKMKIMIDIGQLMVDVSQSATGQKNDFTHDFVKGVCSESVV